MPLPSGAWTSPQNTVASSGSSLVNCRNMSYTSRAAASGWATSPPRITSSGWVSNSNEAATPKLPPPPAERPEQVGLGLRVDDPHLAVRGDELDLDDVVDGQPVLAHEPAQTAAQRQAGDAGRRHDAAGGRLPVDAGGPVVLVPGDATLGPGPPAARVDVDAAHQGQVDHQPAVGHGATGHVVAAAPHRDLQAAVAAEVHGVTHVGDGVAAGDQPRSLVDQAVVHGPRHVVAGIAGSDQRAVERSSQLVRHRHAHRRNPLAPGASCTRAAWQPRHRRGGVRRKHPSLSAASGHRSRRLDQDASGRWQTASTLLPSGSRTNAP